MRVYCLNTSEDGLQRVAATNLMSLYRIIVDTGLNPLKIMFSDRKSKDRSLSTLPFSLENIEKSFKLSRANKDYYLNLIIVCENNVTIEVKELSTTNI